jgi:hypothetical protein
MKNKSAFFDAATITLRPGVLTTPGAHLPPGQRGVNRSLLAERILKAAREGERDPARPRARAASPRRYGSPRSGPRCRSHNFGCPLLFDVFHVALKKVG